MNNFKTRIKHTAYLVPAVFMFFMWDAMAPLLIATRSQWELMAGALVFAMLCTWCITIFTHALQRDKQGESK